MQTGIGLHILGLVVGVENYGNWMGGQVKTPSTQAEPNETK